MCVCVCVFVCVYERMLFLFHHLVIMCWLMSCDDWCHVFIDTMRFLILGSHLRVTSGIDVKEEHHEAGVSFESNCDVRFNSTQLNVENIFFSRGHPCLCVFITCATVGDLCVCLCVLITCASWPVCTVCLCVLITCATWPVCVSMCFGLSDTHTHYQGISEKGRSDGCISTSASGKLSLLHGSSQCQCCLI